jgi:predicted aspartyl protease
MTSIGSFSLDPDVRFWRFTNQTRSGWISPRCEFSARPNGDYVAPRNSNEPIPIVFDTGATYCLMNTGLVEFLRLSDTGVERPISLADGTQAHFKVARGFVRIEGSDAKSMIFVAHHESASNRILLPISILKWYQVLLTHSESVWVEGL